MDFIYKYGCADQFEDMELIYVPGGDHLSMNSMSLSAKRNKLRMASLR